MQLLEKKPGDRPQSADETLRLLESAVTPSGSVAFRADAKTPARERPATTQSTLSRVNVLVAIALVALVAILYGRRQLGWQSASRSAPVAREQTIAVLPFANIGNDSAAEYFSDGVTEELISSLARLESLRVSSRTSSFALKGKNLGAQEIGAKLGVGNVLEGSVQRSGNQLRVTARLVSASDGYQVWSQSYNREVKDVFAVQDDIARAIAGALRVKLGGGSDSLPSRRPTNNLAAYELYLKGRFALSQRTREGLAEATRLFEEATARDSMFAVAHAALADAYLLGPLYGGIPPARAWPRVKATGAKALKLDSTLAEAHTALAYGKMLFDWDWKGAEAGFRRAIAENPSYATAHHWYADFLAGQGRFDESLQEMRLAQQLDPLSQIIGSETSWVLYLQHRPDEAIAEANRTLALSKTFSQVYLIIGLSYLLKRDYTAAITAMQKGLDYDESFPFARAAMIYAHAVAGNREKALTLVDEMKARAAREYVPPFALAVSYAGLGDNTTAFAMLNKAIDEKDVLMPENITDPMLDRLRTDPRYETILRRMRIEDPR
jgi:TolB-like protein/Tfp pilus assembly protein PilF